MTDLQKIKEFLIGVGVVTSIMVVFFWLLGNFVAPLATLECRNLRTSEVGLAARGRGNTVAYAIIDAAGNTSYQTKSSHFTCADVYGKDWIDAR